MVKSFKLAGAVATAAMLLSAASPAAARPGWGGGNRGGGWHHGGGGYGGGWNHRRGNGISFGDVVLGAVIVGGVAAVANAAANGPAARGQRTDRDYDGSVRGDRDGGDQGYDDDRAPASPEEDAAVDRCAAAAEREAGEGSRVGSIRYAKRDGEGWRVEGDVTERRGYGQNFVCGVRADRVDFVQLNDRLAVR